MERVRTRVFAAFIALCVAVRLFPYVLQQFGMSIDPGTTIYPWNFSPLYAVCIFAAATFADRRFALAIPLLALLVGDLGIWILTGNRDFAFYAEQPMVYLSFGLMAATGFLLQGRQKTWINVGATGLLGAVVFFFVSNFGVWAFGQFHSYPRTLAGLIECYVAAIPFFRFTMVSMAIYLPLLFGFAAVRIRSVETSASLASQAG